MPLVPRAVEIVKQMENNRLSDFVFAGKIEGRPISSSSAISLRPRKGGDAAAARFQEHI